MIFLITSRKIDEVHSNSSVYRAVAAWISQNLTLTSSFTIFREIKQNPCKIMMKMI